MKANVFNKYAWLVAFCCYSPMLFANVLLEGVVTNVLSGDQLVLSTAEQGDVAVRLLGIDAPELAMGGCKAQNFADAAKRALSEKAQGTSVKASCADRLDAAGFALCEVINATESLNFWMVEQGYAWYDKSTVSNMRLQQAEKMAKQRRVGLWLDQLPVVAPWTQRVRCMPGQQH
jgi:endonuclease YncB( thermonuclease family)